MKSCFYVFFEDYFNLVLLVVCFSVLIISQTGKGLVNKKKLLAFFAIDLLTALINIAEVFAANDPSMRLIRTILSVFGYCSKVFLAMLFIMLVFKRNERPRWLVVPAIVNVLINCTAFFSGIVFSFNENYIFVRGPLGYTPFIIAGFYLLLLIYLTTSRFGHRDLRECGVVIVCVVAIVLSAILEAMGIVIRVLETTIAVTVICYYFFLYMDYMKKDILTKLLNRQAYYDCTLDKRKNITGLIVIDINGLKTINDTKGHEAGDQAIQNLANIIRDCLYSSMKAFRVGGDEFTVLLFGTCKEDAENYMKMVKCKSASNKCSCSIGYAFADSYPDIKTLEKIADKKMYEDKWKYYHTMGKDRRR